MSALRVPYLSAMAPWLLAVGLAVLTWLLPPIAQPLVYHDFADQRACWRIPYCLDTVSNALFVLAGGIGLGYLHPTRGRAVFRDRREAWPYRLFFAAAILLGFGSGYYHLDTDNDRLLWDRLAMMLAFMAWLDAIVCERASLRFGLVLLPILIAVGLGSAVYWSWSEAQGAGDLRPYLLMQVYPMLLIPLLLRLYPSPYSGDRSILFVIGLYVLALLCDLGDRPIFTLTGGLVSGHTVKHVVAALAVYWVARHVRWRQTL